MAGFDAALAHAKAAGQALARDDAADFPLDDAARGALKRAFATTQGRWGMCLLKGFPVDRWSEDDAKLAYWGMGLHAGVARTQNPASQYMNDVRDEGAAYKAANGRSRGYNTKAGLDFHMDSADIVALLCRRTAKSGGESLVASTIAAAEELGAAAPTCWRCCKQPFYHHYQGSQDPLQPPYYACPIIGSDPAHFAMRVNRKNIVAAERDFPDCRASRPSSGRRSTCWKRSWPIRAGASACSSSRATCSSSTTTYDPLAHPVRGLRRARRKRHLLRLWLAVPDSQPLPADWETDTSATCGRIGSRWHRGANDPGVPGYEARQAAVMGMAYRPWAVVPAQTQQAAA